MNAGMGCWPVTVAGSDSQTSFGDLVFIEGLRPRSGRRSRTGRRLGLRPEPSVSSADRDLSAASNSAFRAAPRVFYATAARRTGVRLQLGRGPDQVAKGFGPFLLIRSDVERTGAAWNEPDGAAVNSRSRSAQV